MVAPSYNYELVLATTNRMKAFSYPSPSSSPTFPKVGLDFLPVPSSAGEVYKKKPPDCKQGGLDAR